MRSSTSLPLLGCILLSVGCDTADAPTSLTAPEVQLAAWRGTCEVALGGSEARAAIDEVREEIVALQEEGSLNRGQAEALRNKLRIALRQIEAGRTCPARAQLQAFLDQVRSFVRNGTLTDAEAEPLLEGVELVLSGPPAVSSFDVIAAGRNHTCGITPDGAAYCWGANTSGALGDGTTTDRSVPTRVVGGHVFTWISAGQFATCALEDDGDAYCWGDNTDGQLGDGTTTNRWEPTPVSGGHAFTSVSAGGNFFVCGLTTDGDAYCWGRAGRGQLGTGTNLNHSVPTAVSGGHTFVSITAGGGHACGLEADGDAYCWGENEVGTLGDGSTLDSPVPTAVTGGHTFTSVNAGHGHVCALKANGDAYCWGWNDSGRLGDGTTTDRLVPTPVSGGHSFAALGRGFGHHTCALEADGDAYCWGFNNLGQLGDGTTTPRSVPTPLDGEHEFTAIAVGGAHTCGLEAEGDAYCWGFNSRGQLGDGTTTDRLLPTAVSVPTSSP